MNNSFTFEKSFLPPMISVLNSDYWNTVMANYDEKKHLETIYAVLDYIKPGISQKSLDAERTKYTLSHGSIQMNLEIADNEYRINAPFLRIPARSLIPLMRQVAEINFGTLVLAQIVIEGTDIYFRYNSPLELCEPYKLYRVLEEICIQADANDDVFIDKFGAQRFSVMDVVPFSPEEVDKAYEKYQQFLNEALAYIDYFESKRMEYFGWDALYLAFTRIDYYMRPQGVLKSEVEKAVKDLNSSAQMPEKLQKGRSTVQKMLQMDKQKFAESLYQSKEFISEKPKYEITGVQDYLNKSYNTARDERSKRDYIGSTLSLLCGIYGLMYYYNIPQTTHDILTDGLGRANNRAWADASDALWNTYESVMNQNQKTASASGLRDI
ncbi:MAG: hypothetical protein MUE85_15445 [Microscillaceae bacterium]|jgi:hypothetical protein|nr:hypothetical protein [Microscillaceae bacterium]